MNATTTVTSPHETSTRTARMARWLARLAFVAAMAAVVLLLAVAGVRSSILLLVVGVLGIAIALSAGWWFLVHRGVVRWLAAGLAVAAPLVVALLYARAGLWWLIAICAAL